MKKTMIFILLMASAWHSAQARNETFTKEEADKLSSYFVKKGCNIDGVFKMTEDYEFDAVVNDRGDSVPLTKLLKSELCLISRSYVPYMSLYGLKPSGDIDVYNWKKRSIDKYPKEFNPNSIVFAIPNSQALKCDDNGMVSAKVTFRKIDGKITREIWMDRDRTWCNSGDLGLPKDFDKQ